MDKQMVKSVLMRAGKSFIAGGIGGFLGALSTSSSSLPTTLEQLRTWVLTLGVAFIVGGCMAWEKAYNWEPTQAPQ